MTAEASSGSVAFDRAASFYDQTRVLPPEIFRSALDRLERELGGRGRILEIGVGTGRFALPLAERRLDITGIDLSMPMIARLREKSSATARCHVARADATALPFPDDSFGGALSVHVLHLIADWREAVSELARVVRPGGVLIFDLGRTSARARADWQGLGRDLEDRFLKEAGVSRRHPGIVDTRSLDQALGRSGAVRRDLDPIAGVMHVAPAVVIKLFEQGIFSCVWDVEPDIRRRAADATRRWFAQTHGDLDAPRPLETVVALHAYDLRE